MSDTLIEIPGVGIVSLREWEDYFKQQSYLSDPVLWVNEKLGEFTWSKQKEILRSVASNRRTAVYSCHRIGKSFIAGRLAIWWIDCHKPGTALVITTSHSAAQVKSAIWREIGRIHAKGKFPGRMNQAQWYMTMPEGNEELVAFGRKPADDDTTAFQGTYSQFILVLVDEACYISQPLWTGLDTLISNESSRAVAFGNPDDPNTEFGEVCKPGSGWNTIRIGYDQTPNFTGESVPKEVRDMLIGPTWVEEKKSKWGENSPSYISKVLGQFPQFTTDGLIPIRWIRDAQERTLEPVGEIGLGVDVGGGGDASTIARRDGPVVRIVHADQNPDTMQTLSAVIEQIRLSNATFANVDYIGIGHGAVDRAREMASDQQIKRETPERASYAGRIRGVEAGGSAKDKEAYINLRAEGYWLLRERFREGLIDIDPADDELAAQLSAIKYKRSGGRIQIESKKEMLARGIKSPDRADAVMMSFLDVTQPVVRINW